MALLALLPFHALLTTWAGSLFGYREIWQAWKEILVLGLLAGVGFKLITDRQLRRFLWGYWSNRLILVYGLLHLLMAIIMSSDLDATLLGLRNNLIFLAIFIIGQTIAFRSPSGRFKTLLPKIILVTAAIVAIFGLLQAYLLPYDFLAKFGYGEGTIPPYLLLQDSEIVRVISTLDSPNTLGSWLILPWALSLTLLLKKRIDSSWWLLPPTLFLALYHSHSRSAWIGVALATVFIGWRILPKHRLRQATIVLFSGLLIVAAALIYLVPKVPVLQSVFLHAPLEKASDESSNADHLEEIIKGIPELVHNPLGKGPGAAGPASLESNNPDITENYFLQVGLEVGFIGLGLFLAINYLIARDLWRASRQSLLAVALLASFIGLSFMNLLLHTWANGPTAITWWGLAGLMLGIWRLKPRPEPTSGTGRSRF